MMDSHCSDKNGTFLFPAYGTRGRVECKNRAGSITLSRIQMFISSLLLSRDGGEILNVPSCDTLPDCFSWPASFTGRNCLPACRKNNNEGRRDLGTDLSWLIDALHSEPDLRSLPRVLLE